MKKSYLTEGETALKKAFAFLKFDELKVELILKDLRKLKTKNN